MSRTLGDRGVNIAQMNVGREQQGGEAIGVVNLDSVPTPEALAAVEQHPDILSVSVIKLPGQGELPRSAVTESMLSSDFDFQATG